MGTILKSVTKSWSLKSDTDKYSFGISQGWITLWTATTKVNMVTNVEGTDRLKYNLEIIMITRYRVQTRYTIEH